MKTNEQQLEAQPALGVVPGSAGWQPIATLPRDGRRVLVWAAPMSEPDIAWHEESESTIKTYTHWHALPALPNALAQPRAQ